MEGRLKNPFALDLRALAAFRIALGSILLVDLALRLTEIGAHYATDAAYPIDSARALLTLPVSLHLSSGAPWFQATLLGVAMLAAALLVAGWRTRWMTVISWYLLVSLHHRSYHIQDVGDQLLRLLLLWGIFLPLGARYAVDARRTAGVRDPYASIASAGLVLQIGLLYFISVFHKLQGETWLAGGALRTVLEDDVWVRAPGALLLEIPWLPRALTYFTLVVETVAPLLLVSPFATRACRRIAVFFLAVFALGIGFSLKLGVIPWVLVATLLPFLSGATYDRLDRRLGVARDPGPAANTHRGPGWRRVLSATLPAVLLVQTFVAAIDGVRYPSRVPAWIKRVEFALGLDQAWGMYAPDPLVYSFRLHLRLDLADGESVKLVFGSPRRGWPPGDTLPALETFWNSYRGRMLLDNIAYPEFFPDMRAFLVWACRQWSAQNPDRPVRSAGIGREERAVRPAAWTQGRLHKELGYEPLIGHVCADTHD